MSKRQVFNTRLEKVLNLLIKKQHHFINTKSGDILRSQNNSPKVIQALLAEYTRNNENGCLHRWWQFLGNGCTVLGLISTKASATVSSL